MLPHAGAASEGSDEPAHPHSLAMDIATHIHNESAYSSLSGTLNDSSGSSYVHTDTQTKFCMLLHHALRTESAHEMLPHAHAAREGSDEPAHPHSLARDIAAHIHNVSAYSPTRWLCIIHQ